MNGWVKIYRSLLADEIWEDGEPFDKRSAWLDLILRAAYHKHEERTPSGSVTIERGELLTNEMELAARWRWSRGRVRRFLEAKRRDGKAAMRRAGNGTKAGTILTIENYTKYQGGRPRDETKGETRDETRGEPADDTNKNNNIYINNYNKESLRIVKEDKEGRLAELRRRRDQAAEEWRRKA